MSFRVLLGLLALALAVLCPRAGADDFPQFRGPAGTGVVPKADPPTDWAKGKGVAWKADLPGTGWSQPVVVGDTVFATVAVGDKLARPKDMAAGARDPASMPFIGKGKAPDVEVKWQVLALDAKTGTRRWATTVVEGKPKFPVHPSNTYATETPCADADRVYAYFGATGTVAALGHDGKEVWKVELGAYPHSNGFGSGSSPTLYDGKVILNCFSEEKGFVVALDAKTGREAWKQERTKAGSAWASPLVWQNSKRVEVIACGDKLVTAHHPATGKELWRLGGIDTAFAPSPAVDGDTLILAASSPFSASPMYAVKAGASGEITLKPGDKSSASVAWFQTKAKVGMASPVAAKGYVYFATDGLLTCYETATGRQVYSERVPGNRMVTACPALVGDKLLVLDENGKATWVKTGPEFETFGGGDLKDTFWASPALAGDKLYLRGVSTLYCLAK